MNNIIKDLFVHFGIGIWVGSITAITWTGLDLLTKKPETHFFLILCTATVAGMLGSYVNQNHRR